MTKPGRNDPCPCGSGRKYKRCCMGREEERARFAAEVDRVALPVLSEVARFAQRFAPPDAVARQYFSFWGGRLDDARARRVIDFLMFELRLEGFGRRAIEQFALERGAQLGEEERRLLERWEQSGYRLYAVDRWSGGFVRCTDALATERGSIEVLPLHGRGPLREGSAVALRALACANGYFSAGYPTEFGRRSPIDVVNAVKGRHIDFVRRQRIVGLEDFLRMQPTVLDEEAAVDDRASIIVPGRSL